MEARVFSPDAVSGGYRQGSWTTCKSTQVRTRNGVGCGLSWRSRLPEMASEKWLYRAVFERQPFSVSLCEVRSKILIPACSFLVENRLFFVPPPSTGKAHSAALHNREQPNHCTGVDQQSAQFDEATAFRNCAGRSTSCSWTWIYHCTSKQQEKRSTYLLRSPRFSPVWGSLVLSENNFNVCIQKSCIKSRT